MRRCTRVLFSLEYDSIANHLDDLDGMVVSYRCMEAMRQCGLSPRRGRVEVGYSRHAEYFTGLVLSLAWENQWEEVGTSAYGNGDHRGILRVAEGWEKEYPRKLRIFYLEAGDFADVIPGFVEREG